MSTLNVISNYAANVAHRNLESNNSAATNSVAKLSSGTRVMSGKDDAAALAIGTRLNGEVTALRQANINAGQAVSMLQIADGAMSRIGDIADRMKSLAVQAGSGQLSSTERGFLNDEFAQLRDEMERIAQATNFNGTKLIAQTEIVSYAGGELSTADNADGSSNTYTEATLRLDFSGAEAIVDGDTVTVNYVENGEGQVQSLTFKFVEAVDTSVTDDGTASAPFQVELGDSKVEAIQNLKTALDTQFASSDGWTVEVSGQAISITGDPTETVGIASGSDTDIETPNLTFDYKVGTGTTENDGISIAIDGLDQSSIDDALSKAFVDADLAAMSFADHSLDTAENADNASEAMDVVIDRVAASRADLGASMNRLEFASANLSTVIENTEAARSQLMDLDIASEISNFTSKQILVQAGTSMLAQANQLPQNLMRLFN